MERYEEHAISEVERVVDNYNSYLYTNKIGDTGTIKLDLPPDDPLGMIDSILLIMQQKMVALRKQREGGLANDINSLLSQVDDMRGVIRGGSAEMAEF